MPIYYQARISAVAGSSITIYNNLQFVSNSLKKLLIGLKKLYLYLIPDTRDEKTSCREIEFEFCHLKSLSDSSLADCSNSLRSANSSIGTLLVAGSRIIQKSLNTALSGPSGRNWFTSADLITCVKSNAIKLTTRIKVPARGIQICFLIN